MKKKKTLALTVIALMVGLPFYAFGLTTGLPAGGPWEHPCVGDELKGSDFGAQYWQSKNRPVQLEDARAMVVSYIKSLNEPDLRLRGVIDEGAWFRGIVLKKQNNVAREIIVEKKTATMVVDCS
jgi:hypothetical protein